MNGRSIVWASVAMAAVLAVVSALKYDFMTVAVAILYAAVLLYPLRRDGRVYHNSVALTALAGLIVLVTGLLLIIYLVFFFAGITAKKKGSSRTGQPLDQ